MPIHTITGGGGLQLVVHEYGQPHGKPILLIHGFSACHLIWSKQYRSSLADEFRLVCLDNRGHGMSDKPTASEHYTQGEHWAEDVQAVIRVHHDLGYTVPSTKGGTDHGTLSRYSNPYHRGMRFDELDRGRVYGPGAAL